MADYVRPSIVLPPRSCFAQYIDNRSTAGRCSPIESRHAEAVHCVQVGAGSDKELNAIHTATVSGLHQGSIAVLIGSVQICACRNERLDEIRIPFTCGPVQGSYAA